MATVQEQMNDIKTKNDLIKWLVNEYFNLSNKAYGDDYKEIRDVEIKIIKDKADELINDVKG